ncbi:hypothetical protein [Paenibacillus sp. OK076]|uniref:hypothetical protein n=1 Tax=Paenibacillus sp. OK076 TaxID=1884379 RepID=UPI000B8499F9|nr:hypothetical protein [Paenibacillus sp. OK076]
MEREQVPPAMAKKRIRPRAAVRSRNRQVKRMLLHRVQVQGRSMATVKEKDHQVVERNRI